MKTMVKAFVLNHFGVNCYVVADEASRQCAVVDPAAESPFEDAELDEYIEREGLTVVRILLTHTHVDHIAGLTQCCRRYGLPATLHADGLPQLRGASLYARMMGFEVDNMEDLSVNEVEDGQVLMVGDVEIECRLVPGHCPGSICYVVPSERTVLTGDTLFHMSVGRTDLPGGDYATLIDRLKQRILTLPDDYRVLPGHGIESKVGKERLHNPFLR